MLITRYVRSVISNSTSMRPSIDCRNRGPLENIFIERDSEGTFPSTTQSKEKGFTSQSIKQKRQLVLFRLFFYFILSNV